MPLTKISIEDWSAWRSAISFYGIENWLLLRIMCGTKRLNQFFRLLEASEVRYFRSAQASLSFMGIERRAKAPGFWNLTFLYYIFSKNSRFLGSRRKNEISSSLFAPGKLFMVGKLRWWHPRRKNSSDAHALVTFLGEIRGKGKTSLHCSRGCRYSMEQNVNCL